MKAMKSAAEPGFLHDRFCFRYGTKWLKMHEVLSDQPQTMEEIATAARLKGTCYKHLNRLVQDRLVDKVKENGKVKYKVSELQLEVERLRAENRDAIVGFQISCDSGEVRLRQAAVEAERH